MISKLISLGLVVLILGACVPVQAATVREAGISTSATLLRMNDAQLDGRMRDISALGAKWIRLDFSWPSIQPDNARVYHWKMYDRVVRVAGVHHLKILAVLDYTPRWAQEPRCAKLVITLAAGQKCSPRTTGLFAHFAAVTAYRYRNQAVRAWEIWNEPNLSAYWKTAQPNSRAVHADPESYATFANAAATQIRYHDPDAIVITGGLAPMFEPKYPKGYQQGDYLTRLLPRLNKNLFRGIAVHPYSWPAAPGFAATYNAFYTVDNGPPRYNLRTIMAHAGWGNKQIWATEFGASTQGQRSVSAAAAVKGARPDHVTETVQANIVQQGVDDWYTKTNVGPIFVHADSDQWLVNHKNEGGFGLRRRDGIKKPAYAAFQKSVGQL